MIADREAECSLAFGEQQELAGFGLRACTHPHGHSVGDVLDAVLFVVLVAQPSLDNRLHLNRFGKCGSVSSRQMKKGGPLARLSSYRR